MVIVPNFLMYLIILPINVLIVLRQVQGVNIVLDELVIM